MPRLNKTGWKKMLGDTKASTGDAHLVSRPPGDDPDQMEMFAPPPSQGATATLPPAEKSPGIKPADLTHQLLVASLRSQCCPACGHPKKSAETLCGKDYFRLPIGLRKALYRRLGSGYEQSILKALKFLKATTFHMAKGGQSK